jgi:hypothetical protein
MMQQAWVRGLNWDDKLPNELQLSWEQWFEELTKLNQVKIPRCLRKDLHVKHIEIHGDTSVELVAAKTRLAPLKTISIPRLELMGAVIALRLSKQVCRALEIPLQEVTFWVDSMTVRFWIRGQSPEVQDICSAPSMGNSRRNQPHTMEVRTNLLEPSRSRHSLAYGN